MGGAFRPSFPGKWFNTSMIMEKQYEKPVLRVIEMNMGSSILSNTEPIGGGDDPDIDW